LSRMWDLRSSRVAVVIGESSDSDEYRPLFVSATER
jgi:hypothetical protein